MAVAMLIFMDESGDVGFTVGKASSRFFVLTIVIFDSLRSAEAASNAIRELRTELRLPENQEFKFSTGTSDIAKLAFLRKLAKHDFSYRSVVIDKKLLLKNYPQDPLGSVYMFVADQLFLRAADRIKNAEIIIDKINEPFTRDFNAYLRHRLNTGLLKIVRRVKHKDSKSDNLLQLADMVCGAIFRKYNRGDDSFYKIIRKREEDLWEPV